MSTPSSSISTMPFGETYWFRIRTMRLPLHFHGRPVHRYADAVEREGTDIAQIRPRVAQIDILRRNPQMRIQILRHPAGCLPSRQADVPCVADELLPEAGEHAPGTPRKMPAPRGVKGGNCTDRETIRVRARTAVVTN